MKDSGGFRAVPYLAAIGVLAILVAVLLVALVRRRPAAPPAPAPSGPMTPAAQPAARAHVGPQDANGGLRALVTELEQEYARTVRTIRQNPGSGAQIAGDLVTRLETTETRLDGQLEAQGLNRFTADAGTVHAMACLTLYRAAALNLKGFGMTGGQNFLEEADASHARALAERDAALMTLP